MNVIVGTAGHIDHGKTALIKALTGVDTDRLPEEKDRGITIDLGFAEAVIGDVEIGFIDVPGHEKFVKNMLAGIGGIDLVLLVVAADEGVMPQTREHFDICRLLNIPAGIVALTKCDLVDAETLEFAKADVAELVKDSFLVEAPVVETSIKNDAGIEQLKSNILEIVHSLGRKKSDLITRLPIDRSFTVKGFGAVVTGTLASGELCEGAEMELQPIGRAVRVRGLQSHGRKVDLASAGRRVAVNLGGIDHSEISRGMLLCEKGVLQPTQIVDVRIDLLKNAETPLKSRQRVRVHIGTTEALARIYVLNDVGQIQPGASDFAQLRLEKPIAAVPGERFIIRTYSPQITVAGGRVVNAHADKRRKKNLFSTCEMLLILGDESSGQADKIRTFVENADRTGSNKYKIRSLTGLAGEAVDKAVAALIKTGEIKAADDEFVSKTIYHQLMTEAIGFLEKFHRDQPLARGVAIETIRERVFRFVPGAITQQILSSLATSGKFAADGSLVRLAQYKTDLTDDEQTASDRLVAIYRSAGLNVPKLEDALADASGGTSVSPANMRKLLQLLVDGKKLIKVTDDLYFDTAAIEAIVAKMRQAASADKLIDVGQFKDIAGISRKYAIPLLEYFDRVKITRRAADKRLIL